VAVEVRTVNSRYFKLTARASEGYSALESEIESVVRQHIKRGTVQVNLRVDRIGAGSAYRINDAVLSGYWRQLAEFQKRLHSAETYRQRLTDRLNKILSEYDVRVQPAEIVREVGLFAERNDISEEVVRLGSHLEQFRAAMDLPESAGRKLEFVTQEMFREANT